MSNTPRFGLPLLQAAQAQKHFAPKKEEKGLLGSLKRLPSAPLRNAKLLQLLLRNRKNRSRRSRSAIINWPP